MKLNFKDMLLKQKIILVAVTSASISLLGACLMFIVYERVTYPRIMVKDLANMARLIGDNSTAALSFNDHKTSQDILDTLQTNPHIFLACLYDAQGKIVALYHTDNGLIHPTLPANPQEGSEFTGDSIRLFHVILSGRERVGALYLESDLTDMSSRLASYTAMTFLVIVFSFLVSFLAASRLQRYVSDPLRHVVDRMKDIARGEGDLTKRLEVIGKDEIGEVAEAFNTYVGKLQTVDEMKLDLISVVSHQLKTPVAEINGYIENMLEGLAGELTPKQKKYLESMRRIGWENYQLISDLLSASKIERGVIAVDLRPLSVKHLVELSIRDYQEPIRKKGLSLYLEGFDQDIKVVGDQDKTVETLRNLINNALKCTDKGSITIRVLAEGEKGVVEIQDTGIGMSQETLDRLFTKSRVMGKEAGRAGAGLGLYIAKNFMKLQKGDIEVKSELGKGSCFRLELPKSKALEGAAT